MSGVRWCVKTEDMEVSCKAEPTEAAGGALNDSSYEVSATPVIPGLMWA